MIQSIIDFVAGLPPAGIYLAIGTIAAVESIFPPVPADVTAALGGFLAAQNPRISAVVVWTVTVLGNAGIATAVYYFARYAQKDLLAMPLIKRFLPPHTVATIQQRYERHHTWAIFFGRCLPGYRAVIPLCAGMMHIPASKVVPAIVAAAALYYGVVVGLAYKLGANWEAVKGAVGGIGGVLATIAGLVTIALVVLFVRHKRRQP